MNVLIVHNYYKTPGGEDSVVKNEVELLRAHGHNVYTFFKNNEEIDTKGLLKKIALFRNTIFNKSIENEVKSIIKEKNIEIVHCHNTFPLISPSIYKYAKEMGCKVFQTIHNFRFLCASADFVRDGGICKECVDKNIKCALKHKCYHSSFAQTFSWYKLQKNFRKKEMYKYVDKFICLTDFNKQILSNIIPEEKIAVKPNFSFFKADEGCDENKTQFLYIGRIEEIKGIRTLIDAFDREGMPNLVLCGNGSDLEFFKGQTKHANVIYNGFCSKEQLISELSKSIALIVPSNWYEGFPMTIAEAMSMGVPVIARNIGNLPFIVKNGVNGSTFNNEEELAGIVSNLLCDCYLRNKLSLGAKKYAEDELSPEMNYKRLISIYEGR